MENQDLWEVEEDYSDLDLLMYEDEMMDKFNYEEWDYEYHVGRKDE